MRRGCGFGGGCRESGDEGFFFKNNDGAVRVILGEIIKDSKDAPEPANGLSVITDVFKAAIIHGLSMTSKIFFTRSPACFTENAASLSVMEPAVS